MIGILSRSSIAFRLALAFFVCLIGSMPAAMAVEKFMLTSSAEFGDVEKLKDRKIDGKPKIGLALGGGGGRGSAHIGVLKVLDEAGIKFDYVCGTSIGSVIGGLYCAGATPSDLENHFVSGMHRFMTVPLWFRLVISPAMFAPRLIGFHPYDGLYRGNKFRKYVVGKLTDDEQEIGNLKIPFGAVVINLLDGKPYIIRKGDLGYAVQASCAVPSLRKPVEIDGHLFADGGVANNLPVKQCREMGADFVIAVNIDEPFKKEPLEKFRKAGSVSKRMIDWALYSTDEPQMALADVVIHPFTKGISLISAKKSDAAKGVAAGEEAGLDALSEIREKLAKFGIEVPKVAAELGKATSEKVD